MKNSIHTLLIIGVLVLFSTSCTISEELDDAISDSSQLEATLKHDNSIEKYEASEFISSYYNGGKLFISTRESRTNLTYSLFISVEDATVGSFEIGSNVNAGHFGIGSGKDFRAEAGTIRITELTTEGAKGTFNFTGKTTNQSDDVLTVSDGTFDVRFDN